MTASLCEAIAIGVSAGGFRALSALFAALPASLPQAIVVVQHRGADADDFLARHLDEIAAIPVCEATDKQPLKAGRAHVAPGGYHLLVEDDRTLSLSLEPPVNHSRPSIDVLFESAANVYGPALAAVVLTGASSDGARGLLEVARRGGLTIVQDPRTAESPFMPAAALELVAADYVLPLEEIGPLLANLDGAGKRTGPAAAVTGNRRAKP